MKQHLPYIVGTSVVVTATAVLSCYYSRNASPGLSKSEQADSQVPSTTDSEKDPVTGIVRSPSRSTFVESHATAFSIDAEGTTMLRTSPNPLLHAKEITLSQLQKLLKGVPGQKTIYTVAELLYNLKKGGALVVVYDCKGGKDPEATMPVKSLAGGKLRDIMRLYARSLFADYSDEAPVAANFRAILNAWSSVDHDVLKADGSKADRWTKPVLECMAKDLGESWESADSIRLLENQPADGALAILSLRGTVVGASSRIDIKSQQMIELKRKDGKGTGTRHTAAVCAVEWCRLKALPGAAIVRSDTGRLTFVHFEAAGKNQSTETVAYEIVGL